MSCKWMSRAAVLGAVGIFCAGACGSTIPESQTIPAVTSNVTPGYSGSAASLVSESWVLTGSSMAANYTVRPDTGVDPNIWLQFASWSNGHVIPGAGLSAPTNLMSGPTTPGGIHLAASAPLVVQEPILRLLLPRATNAPKGVEEGPFQMQAGGGPAISTSVPLPAAVWMGAATLAAMACGARLRARRARSA